MFILLKEMFMKRVLSIFALTILLALPLQGMAQDHSAHAGKAPPAAPAKSSQPQSMQMHGNMIMLEEVSQAGVKGMVHLMDVGAMMAKMGHKENFHLMVAFTDIASGKALSEGSVALRITGPGQEKAGEPIALMPMSGQFGADISLPGKGLYTLEIGTKLADGTKRQFIFKHTMQ